MPLAPLRILTFSLIALSLCRSTLAEPSSFQPRVEKTKATLYTAARRAAVQKNAERFEWAKQQVEQTTRDAEPWLRMSDEDLWMLVPSPVLMRAIGVNRNAGCPKCGSAIYGDRGPNLYAFEASVPGQPWKVRCPHCKEVFPKNDFAAYYKSGISPKDGLFHYELADRKLLINADHPDPKDPLHTWCVDDGYGWVDGSGNLHAFIAAYNYRMSWQGPLRGAQLLAKAYFMTGKPEYAHKGTILLDRLADVFPDLNGRNRQLTDFAQHRFGDGLIGPNYWSGDGWAGLAMAYDMLYEGMTDDRTLGFIQAQAKKYTVPSPKTNWAEVRRHIEQRIFVDRFSKRETYWMNGTLTEMCEAKVDLVLRERAKEEFAKVHLPRLVPSQFLNDDGSGNEGAIGYDHAAFGGYGDLLIELADLDADLAKRVLTDAPKFQAAFDFWPDILCVDKYWPNIGDAENGPMQQAALPWTSAPYLRLFELTKNEKYARLALMAAKGDAAKLPRNIYAAEPEELIAKAVEVYRQKGPWYAESVVKPNYKLGILRGGTKESKVALWMYYQTQHGTSSHKHFDALNFGLFACDMPLVCEQGYPLFTGDWPGRWNWTSHTRSHATVTIDDKPQLQRPGGKLLAFSGAHGVQMLSAEATEAYDGVSAYRRTLLLVETTPGEPWIVDVFQARGGKRHDYALPLLFGETTTKGVELKDGPAASGGYIEKVRTALCEHPWSVEADLRDTWEGKAKGKLKIHGAASDARLVVGAGETRLGKERPERIPYVLLQRAAKDDKPLDSLFVVALEPYREKPVLAAEPIQYERHEDHVAIRVTQADGIKYAFELRHDEKGNAVLNVERTAGQDRKQFRLP